MRAKLMRKVEGLERELKRLRDEQAKKLARIDHLEADLSRARMHAHEVQVRCDAALAVEHGKAGFIAVDEVALALSQHLLGDSTAIPHLTLKLLQLAQAAEGAQYLSENAVRTCQEARWRAARAERPLIEANYAALERRVLGQLPLAGGALGGTLMEIFAREDAQEEAMAGSVRALFARRPTTPRQQRDCACIGTHQCEQHPPGTPVTPPSV